MASNNKNEVLVRVYLVLFLFLIPIAGLLMYRTIEMAVLDAKENRRAAENNFRTRIIEPDRGDIYSHDGNLLATSIPYYSVAFDPYVADKDVYYDNIDSLAYLLAEHVDSDYTVGAWRDSLFNMRDLENRRRYYRIADQVSYGQLQRLYSFPIFRLGQYRGGIIAEKRSERKRPFGLLGSRTVGSVRNGRMVGIEGAFDEQLAGEQGQEEMFRLDPSSDNWLPMNNLGSIQPTQGADVHTTIDVNIQDIASTALMRAMRRHQPDWGTAIVMDVETGAIRALANLGKTTDGRDYYEMYNYALAMDTEPGSTFKLATIMALMEDELVELDDEVDIEKGEKVFYDDCPMEDSNLGLRRLNAISVRQAFEQSSNVGMAKLADSLYTTDAFRERLVSFGLDLPTGLEIEGEQGPMIRQRTDAEWSACSLPWMAIGYESEVTPLQMLTFYNAVANGGRMMKPYLVDRLEREGLVLDRFRPTVLNDQIASRSTIENAQDLLEGVVERGTAKRLKTSQYRFAGKTGTSQQNYGRTRSRRRLKHQASFAGYFPAARPRYSCIVVIFNPTAGEYYGADVAGPVFREITDNIYNSMIDIHEPINRGPRPVLYADNLPNGSVGYQSDLETIFDFLNMEVDSTTSEPFARVRATEEALLLAPGNLEEYAHPDVRGMRLRDAVYVLENLGYTVHPEGVGRVYDQEWHRDARGRMGRDVSLRLR
ncbi:MAG: penicillin-binding transpeptidase domain-containing protein [Bacteroidota bacterium]